MVLFIPIEVCIIYVRKILSLSKNFIIKIIPSKLIEKRRLSIWIQTNIGLQ